jgi:DNA-binding SARP family transcriptional activator
METQNETDVKRTVLRVTSFGTLSIVCLEPQIGHTGISNENEVPISSDKAQGRGTASALTLLKVLLCQPSRFASRDLLMETLWPDYSRGKAQARLDDTASVLRTLLRSISGSRENLLPSVHSSKESGNGYHLAPYPLVWVDMDAFLWNAEQAARMERFGDDPLPYWERAYALASRGTFLADEPYSEWAHEHRKLLTGQYRQCVHQLARLYRERGGQTQAEQVLRAYVVSHRDDEDALRPLMELLGAQERYQEALEHYEDMKQALALDGHEPDARTRDIAEYVRAKHIKRERAANALALWLAEPRRPLQQHALHTMLPQIDGQEPFHRPDLWPSNQRRGEQELPLALPTTRSSMSSTLILPFSMTQPGKPREAMIPDCATMFGIQLSQIFALIQQWYGMAMFCHELQDQLDLAVKKLDALKLQYRLEEYALSRRSFLVSLAALPVALLTSAKQGQTLVLELEEMLPQCAASIMACWYLSGGSHLEVIEPILDSYLPTLIAVLKHAPAYREVAADLVAQIYSLKAILAWHLEGLNHAETYCIQALNYSIVAKNANLRLTALNQHALISFYARNFKQALAKSEEADATLGRLGDEERIFPIVQGRVYMYLAAIQAQQEYQVDAERTLERVHQAFALQVASAEPVPLYADCGNMSLSLWDGLTHYYLGQHDPTHTQRALNSLQMFGQLQPSDTIPERFRLECLNNRTLAAVQLNEMEEAIACLEAGKQGARDLESKQRRAEVDYAYREIHQLWSAETQVHVLGDPLDGDGK